MPSLAESPFQLRGYPSRTHCGKCGRELEVVMSKRPWRDDQGNLVYEPWLKCPRFERNWKRLRGPGWGHTCLGIGPNLGLQQDWRI